MEIQINELKTGIHPLKRIFADLRIKQITLSRHLGVNYFLLNLMLNGYIPMPKDIQDRLIEFADEIKRESLS